MTLLNEKPTLEEVLDEFFFSSSKPSPTIVLKACEAHPEYREDIVEFAALWSSYEAMPTGASERIINEISEESVSRLQSFVLNRVYEIDSNSVSDSCVDAVQQAVGSLAGAKLKKAAIAAGLGGSSLLLTKVLAQRIKDAPIKILKNLARYLDVDEFALQKCLGGHLVGGMSYKSSGKPNLPQKETWESAVRSLAVSAEEKSRLIALQHEEDLL